MYSIWGWLPSCIDTSDSGDGVSGMTPASSDPIAFSGEPRPSWVSGTCDNGELCGDDKDACAPEPADALAKWLSKFGMKSDMLETFPPQVYLISC